MKTFNTVEDYLEVLAGMRDVATGKLTSAWFLGFTPIISLARYDVDVLTSMSESTANNKPLTEKQGTLLCKILLKYQRQFASKGIDVTPIENPVWRMLLRKMDYSHRVSISNDKIILQFPYNSKLIETLREFRNSSQGSCVFNRELKVWTVALTEYNLNWIYTWAKANNFEITQEIETINELILAQERTPHRIELVYDKDQLSITNCPDTLREHIENKLGGFGHDNVLKLIDHSGVLGYTIEPALSDVVIKQWGPRYLTLSKHREVQITPNTNTVASDFASVLEYSIATNRLPVVVYEPDLSNRLLSQLTKLYPSQDVAVILDKRPAIPDGVKFIHISKPIRNLDRIPMLVTSAGMIFGGDKQIMTQRSEKIVYIAADIYGATGGPGNKPRKVVRLG